MSLTDVIQSLIPTDEDRITNELTELLSMHHNAGVPLYIIRAAFENAMDNISGE